MAPDKKDPSAGTAPLLGKVDDWRVINNVNSSQTVNEAGSNQRHSVDDATGYSKEEEEVESKREETS